jgi:hypothetical protein
MKNILIFASIAGIAAAVAIYFVSESAKDYDVEDFVTDADIDYYDLHENTGKAQSI